VALPDEILLGTSAFAAEGWIGSFYPKGMQPRHFLSYYATKFNTVELDNTFYRTPSFALYLCGDQPFLPTGYPRLTLTRVRCSFTYSPFAFDVPLFAAVFTTTRRHANQSVHILIRPPLPNQRSESHLARSASSKLRPPKNLTSAVSSS